MPSVTCEHDAIVAAAEETVRDIDFAAGDDIDAVTIWDKKIIVYSNPSHFHSFAVDYKKAPERRIDASEVFEDDIFAAAEHDHLMESVFGFERSVSYS